MKEYITFIMVLIGIGMGLLTGYLRSFSSHSFWAFSDIAGRYGVWIFTVALIPCFARTIRTTRIYTFTYLISMCLAYYGYLYLAKGILYIKELLFWSAFTVITTIFVKYLFLGREQKLEKGYIVNAIPVILLSIEAISMIENFVEYRTNFLQMCVDIVAVVVLYFAYNQDKVYKRKVLFVVVITVLIICLGLLILRNL